MPSTYYLFVYGSLRSGFKNPAYEYISHFFELIGVARAKGKLYDMGQYPAAVPGGENHYLVGELYRIKDEHEFSWAFGQLDDYEGLDMEPGETPEYRREITEVEFQEKKFQAWIYWYNASTEGCPIIESGDVLKYIQDKTQI